MGFYVDTILPRITDLLLGTKAFGKVRREECEGLRGDVIELGFGSGTNLPHLPTDVTGLWAVEPSGTARTLAAKRIAASPIPVHMAGLDGARLDLPDERFDAALSTMTLCTIPDVEGALRELRRVMKHGAPLHFAEHGHAPDAKVARRQDRFTPLQRRIAGGCHLNRDIASLLTSAGFQIERCRNFYLRGPKPVGYMFVGVARNP
jgi:SAM-dependent methyltransferase